jgi:hypothetical protein
MSRLSGLKRAFSRLRRKKKTVREVVHRQDFDEMKYEFD